MTGNSIEDDLFAQAKQHLSSGEFEEAAKTARAVLALDQSNEEAANILKAASAVIEPPEEQTKTELRKVAAEVQISINSRDFSEAERLIRRYLGQYPSVADAAKILSDVQIAHRKYDTQENAKRNEEEIERQESQEEVRSILTSMEKQDRVLQVEAYLQLVGFVLVVIFMIWLYIAIF